MGSEHSEPTGTSRWQITCQLAEDDHKTVAVATLRTGSRVLQAVGSARRSPAAPNLPRVGEDLALARALSQLSHDLLTDAVGQLEAVTHGPAGVRER